MIHSKGLVQFSLRMLKKKSCDTVMCFSVMLHPLFLLLCCSHINVAFVDASDVKVFHNHFAVHIANATSGVVDHIAGKHGFRNLGQVLIFSCFYHYIYKKPCVTGLRIDMLILLGS
jgi:Peptidase S8 pro-domain